MSDNQAGASAFSLSLLEAMVPQIEKQHPLFSKVEFEITSVGRGEFSCLMSAPALFNDRDQVQGGMFTIFLDTILAMTIYTRMEAFQPVATINLKTDYLEPVIAGERFAFDAHCHAIRDDVAYCNGMARRVADNRAVAHAAGTFLVGTKNRQGGSRL